MIVNTQEKLRKILEKHTEYRQDFSTQLTKAESKLREAIQVKSFGDNDIMKKLRGQYAKYIHDINEVLLYKEKLSEEERVRLLDRRRIYFDFLQMFTNAKLAIENIDRWITDEFTDEDL